MTEDLPQDIASGTEMPQFNQSEHAAIASAQEEDAFMKEAGTASRKIIGGMAAAGTAATIGIAAVLTAGNGAPDSAPKHEIVVETHAPTEDAAPISIAPTVEKSVAPATVKPTDTIKPKAEHTIVITPPKTAQTSPAPKPTISHEAQQPSYEVQLDAYAQSVGKEGEALDPNKWTKSVNGDTEKFVRAANVKNNDTAHGEYQLLIRHNTSGKVTGVEWQTVAIANDGSRVQVLDAYNLTFDGGWIGKVQHYTVNGPTYETYKGQQWVNNVQSFEERMDTVGNNGASDPPQDLVYPT